MNPNRFTEKDFALSKLMSYATCLPVGYPELPDEPDMLMFAPGSDEDERVDEAGGDDGGLIDDNDDDKMDEVVNDDGKGDEVDEDDGEDDKTDGEIGETDDDGDNGIADEGMNTDHEGEESAGEEFDDVTVGGTDTLSNAGHPSRYERGILPFEINDPHASPQSYFSCSSHSWEQPRTGPDCIS